MADPGTNVPAPDRPSRQVAGFGWRRRQFVVDARYQLRSGILVGLVAIVLLVLLNLSLVVPDRTSSPAGFAAARSQGALSISNGSSFALLLLGSAVFLGGAFLVGLLESHRTAGAAFAIRRAVDGIRDGQSQVRVRLRRGDHLQELARSINRLAETIDSERLRRG